MTGREVAVRSRTTPGVAYRVLIGIDGELTCTCAGYEFRATCWHTEHVRKYEMTNEEHALVPIQVQPPAAILPTREELSVIGLIAKSVMGARGHAVPQQIDSPAKAAAVMLAGHELGVKPMTALRHIMVINGKTEPDAQLMAGIVIAREQDARIEVVKLTDTECTMRLVRPSRGINAEYTYRLDEAKKAGLVKGGSNWDKFPRDMMRWAATKRLCRAYAPDLINSVGSVEVGAAGELMEAVSADADVIEHEPDGYLDAGSVPAESLYNEGDVPEGVDPETGEVVDGDFTEEPDEGPEGESEHVPVSVEALEAARALVLEVAEAANAPAEVVLSGWGADYTEVASNLASYRDRFEQWKARKATKAGASS